MIGGCCSDSANNADTDLRPASTADHDDDDNDDDKDEVILTKMIMTTMMTIKMTTT